MPDFGNPRPARTAAARLGTMHRRRPGPGTAHASTAALSSTGEAAASAGSGAQQSAAVGQAQDGGRAPPPRLVPAAVATGSTSFMSSGNSRASQTRGLLPLRASSLRMPLPVRGVGVRAAGAAVATTSVVAHPEYGAVFAGHADGSVSVLTQRAIRVTAPSRARRQLAVTA